MSDSRSTDEVPKPEPGADDAWGGTDEAEDPDQAGPPAEFVDDPQVSDDSGDATTRGGSLPSR